MGSQSSFPNSISPSLLPPGPDPPSITALINTLSLSPNIEGGHYRLTDRSKLLIPSPFPREPASEATLALVPASLLESRRPVIDANLRAASSCIFYLLSPASPVGFFHRNRCRIVHSLHRGRGRYVLIRPDGTVDSFLVGPDPTRGERAQWIVEGGDWKASFLLPDGDGPDDNHSDGLLITEVCIPGFEYYDHDFLTPQKLRDAVGDERARQLEWLVRKP